MSWVSSAWNKATSHVTPVSIPDWQIPKAPVGGVGGQILNAGITGVNMAGTMGNVAANSGIKAGIEAGNTVNSYVNPAGNYVGDRLYMPSGSGGSGGSNGQIQTGGSVGPGGSIPMGDAGMGTPGSLQLPDPAPPAQAPNQWSAYGPIGSWEELNARIRNSQYQGGFDGYGNSTNPNFTVNAAPWVNQGPGSISDEYSQMIKEGKSSGLSNWGKAAYNRSRADQGYAIEDARGQAMQDAGAGMNTLAMQGGLESGAAENMLRNASQNANKSRTDLYRQGSMDRMGIDVADAGRKDTMRTQGLSGSMDVARYDTDVQNLNVQNRLTDLQRRNDFEAGKLGMEGAMAGARATSDAMTKSANSQSSSGSDGGVLNHWGKVLTTNPAKWHW